MIHITLHLPTETKHGNDVSQATRDAICADLSAVFHENCFYTERSFHAFITLKETHRVWVAIEMVKAIAWVDKVRYGYKMTGEIKVTE